MLQLYQALLSAFFVTVILDSPFLGKKTDHRQTGMGNLICNHFMYDLNKGLSHGSKPMCLFLVLILMFIYMILLTLSALPPLSLHHVPLLSATWLCCLYPPHLPSLLVCPLPSHVLLPSSPASTLLPYHSLLPFVFPLVSTAGMCTLYPLLHLCFLALHRSLVSSEHNPSHLLLTSSTSTPTCCIPLSSILAFSNPKTFITSFKPQLSPLLCSMFFPLCSLYFHLHSLANLLCSLPFPSFLHAPSPSPPFLHPPSLLPCFLTPSLSLHSCLPNPSSSPSFSSFSLLSLHSPITPFTP